jgi:GNAT superfamily N-acetyltransferase
MTVIRRLGPGDETILRVIGADDSDFDVGERGGARAPLSTEAARRYLSDASVVHWVAHETEKSSEVLGHLHCQLVRKHAGEESELLLYEIGVRAAARRKGVGRALMATMETWMRDNAIPGEAWVLADNPGATDFYVACGFSIAEDAPVYLTRKVVGT